MMRRILAGLAVFLFSSGTHAQGVTGLFRSVTSALQGGQTAPQHQGPTPVMGVRGMDQANEVAAAPATSGEENIMMEGWSSTRPEAEALARKKGLTSRPVSLGKTEAAEGGAVAR